MEPRHPARPCSHGLTRNIRCDRAIGLVMALLMITTGCTSIRSFEGPQLDRLQRGELVTIYQTSGRISRLYITTITDKEVSGQYQPGQPIVSIPRSGIDSVEVERTDYAKSVAAGVGGVVVGAIALMVVFIGALAGATK